MKSSKYKFILFSLLFIASFYPLLACDDNMPPDEFTEKTELIRAIDSRMTRKAIGLINSGTDVNEKQHFKFKYPSTDSYNYENDDSFIYKNGSYYYNGNSNEHHIYKTPLYYAVEKKQVNVVQLLLEKGALQNATYHYRNDVKSIYIEEWQTLESELDELKAIEIYLALYMKDIEIFDLLLKHYPDRSTLPIIDLFRATLAYKDSSFLEILLKNKLDIYMPENYIETVLINAINCGASGSIPFLLEKYGPENFFSNFEDRIITETVTLRRGIPLMEYLLEEYSKTVSSQEFQDELIKLFILAITSSYGEMASFLFNQYKELSPEQSKITEILDNAFFTCLNANRRNIYSLVSFFIEENASLTKIQSEGKTVLIIAVLKGYDNVIPLLVEAGADPDFQDMFGSSALDYAKTYANMNSEQILRKYSSTTQSTKISMVSSTSTLETDKRYSGELAFDETGGKAWIEGSAGSGVGNSITIYFREEIQFDSISFSDNDNNLSNISLNDITGVTINGTGVKAVQNETGKLCIMDKSIQSKYITIKISQISTEKIGSTTGIWNLHFFLNAKKISLDKSNIRNNTPISNNRILQREILNEIWDNEKLLNRNKSNIDPFNYGQTEEDNEYGDFFNFDQYGKLSWIFSIKDSKWKPHSYFLNDSGSVFFLESIESVENKNILVIWLDKYGQLVRSLSYGGLKEETLNKAIPLENEEYLLIGTSNSFIESDEDLITPWFIKIDRNGEILWQKTLPKIELKPYSSSQVYQIEKISSDRVAILINRDLYILNGAGDILNAWYTVSIDSIKRKAENDIYCFLDASTLEIIEANLISKEFTQIGKYDCKDIFTKDENKEIINKESGYSISFFKNPRILCDGEIIIDFRLEVSMPHAGFYSTEKFTISDFDPKQRVTKNHYFREFDPNSISTQTHPQLVFTKQYDLILYGNYKSSFHSDTFFTNPNVSNLNVRDSPGLKGNVIFQINETNRIQILEKSEETSMIGPMEAYWYKINVANTNTTPKEGWVYGYFLGIFKDDLYNN